jgi:hypothetical protein
VQISLQVLQGISSARFDPGERKKNMPVGQPVQGLLIILEKVSVRHDYRNRSCLKFAIPPEVSIIASRFGWQMIDSAPGILTLQIRGFAFVPADGYRRRWFIACGCEPTAAQMLAKSQVRSG